MKRRRKIKITRTQGQSMRIQSSIIRAYCPVCEREVETLTRTQAAEVLEVDDRGLSRLIASAQVHTIRTVSGSLRVCKESLFEPAKYAEDAKGTQGSGVSHQGSDSSLIPDP